MNHPCSPASKNCGGSESFSRFSQKSDAARSTQSRARIENNDRMPQFELVLPPSCGLLRTFLSRLPIRIKPDQTWSTSAGESSAFNGPADGVLTGFTAGSLSSEVNMGSGTIHRGAGTYISTRIGGLNTHVDEDEEIPEREVGAKMERGRKKKITENDIMKIERIVWYY